MKDFLKIFGQRPIAIYPIFIDITGNLTTAYLLCQVCYWWYANKEKPFYKTNKEFCQELHIKDDKFKLAKKKLESLKLITIELKDLPSKTYYSLNADVLEASIYHLVGKPPEVSGKPTTALVGNPPTINTENIIDSVVPQIEATTKPVQVGILPPWTGKQPLQRLIRVYSILWEERYGFAPDIENFGKLGKLFYPLLKKYTEYQIASFIILHFEWRGATGEDEFTHKRLIDRCFPLEWIPKNVNEYKAYLVNALNIDFENHKEVKEYVAQTLNPILKNKKNVS